MTTKTPRIDRIDRQYFMNGGSEYFQRGGVSSAVAVGTSFDYITMDRFDMKVTGTWTTPTSQRSSTKLGTLARRSHLFQGTPTNLADTFVIRQKIESVFAKDLINDVFSLGLKYKGDNFTTLDITLYTADVEDDFSAVTQIDTTSITITDDSTNQRAIWENITTDAGIARGLMVEFAFSGLGALAATNLFCSEFVLNIGKEVNDYSTFGRDEAEELLLCQRYAWYPNFNTQRFLYLFRTGVQANKLQMIEYPVPMRAIPIVTATISVGTITIAEYQSYVDIRSSNTSEASASAITSFYAEAEL